MSSINLPTVKPDPPIGNTEDDVGFPVIGCFMSDPVIQDRSKIFAADVPSKCIVTHWAKVTTPEHDAEHDVKFTPTPLDEDIIWFPCWGVDGVTFLGPYPASILDVQTTAEDLENMEEEY